MPLRFYRRVKVLPGVSVNISKSGPALSLGVRGAHLTFGRNGVRRTVGVPGTGIYYTTRDGYHTGAHAEGGAIGSIVFIIVLGIVILLAVSHQTSHG